MSLRLTMIEGMERRLQELLAQPGVPGSSLPADEAEVRSLLGGIKFNECLSGEVARALLERRMEDPAGVEAVRATPVRWITAEDSPAN